MFGKDKLILKILKKQHENNYSYSKYNYADLCEKNQDELENILNRETIYLVFLTKENIYYFFKNHEFGFLNNIENCSIKWIKENFEFYNKNKKFNETLEITKYLNESCAPYNYKIISRELFLHEISINLV